MPLEAPAELAEKPDYLAKITALEGEIEALTATITQKEKDNINLKMKLFYPQEFHKMFIFRA